MKRTYYFPSCKIILILMIFLIHGSTFASVLIDNLYYELNGSEASVVYNESYNNLDDIIIPESINYEGNNYQITTISYSAFKNCNIKSIHIPSSIRSIYSGAFSGCNNLKKIDISDLKAWCNISFEGYWSRTLPETPYSKDYHEISEYSSYANPLEFGRLYINGEIVDTLFITEDIQQIEKYAFYGAYFKDIIIENKYLKIEDNAFQYCHFNKAAYPDYLKNNPFGYWVWNIWFPGGEYYAVYRESRENVITFNQYSIIENGDIYNNSKTKLIFVSSSHTGEFIVPEGIQEIGTSAFAGCSELTSIILSDAITSLGTGLFSGCDKLENIHLGNSISEIPSFMFKDCKNLQSIYLGENIKSIEGGAFLGCTSLKSLSFPNSLKIIGNEAFSNCISIKSLTFPNSLEEIGQNAFRNCNSLSDIYFGSGLKSIGLLAFEGCNNLKFINIDDILSWLKINFTIKNWSNSESYPESRYYMNIYYSSNPLYYAKKLYVNGDELIKLEIPDNITSISDGAFVNCTGLKEIDFGSSLQSVGWGAFSGCENINKVNVKNISDWCNINFSYYDKSYSYYNVIDNNSIYRYGTDYYSNPLYICHKLYLNDELVEKLVIPDDVTIIPDIAFIGCDDIKKIVIGKKVKKFGYKCFSGCNNLSQIFLTDITEWCNASFDFSILIELDYGYYPERKEEQTDYSSNPIIMGCNLFYNDKQVIDLVIPDNVTNINEYTFKNCSQIQSITLGSSLQKINKEAFANCGEIKSLTVRSSDPQFHESSFMNTSYKNVVIDGNMFKGTVFKEDNRICSVLFTENVEEIGPGIFNGCGGITSIKFPDSLETIGENSFANCFNLEKVSFGKSTYSIGDGAFEGCTNIANIECLANIPPYASSTTFDRKIYSSCNLQVLEESVKKYENTDPWQRFMSIGPLNFSGFSNIFQENSLITVYDIEGNLVLNKADSKMIKFLNPGMYIVNGKKFVKNKR